MKNGGKWPLHPNWTRHSKAGAAFLTRGAPGPPSKHQAGFRVYWLHWQSTVFILTYSQEAPKKFGISMAQFSFSFHSLHIGIYIHKMARFPMRNKYSSTLDTRVEKWGILLTRLFGCAKKNSEARSIYFTGTGVFWAKGTSSKRILYRRF